MTHGTETRPGRLAGLAVAGAAVLTIGTLVACDNTTSRTEEKKTKVERTPEGTTTTTETKEKKVETSPPK